MALGAPYIVIVALKAVAADFGGYRSIPSAAASLAMLGTGVGGLGMGWLAERLGVRAVVMFGACMVCAGLVLSSGGEVWQLYVGHGLLIGLIGNGAINAPLYVYVTRWFERAPRHGAGADRQRAVRGRRQLAAAVRARDRRLRLAPDHARLRLVVAAWWCRSPSCSCGRRRRRAKAGGAAHQRAQVGKVLGLPPNVAFALLAGAVVPVLRADGDAVLASDRAVRRSGAGAGARRRRC